MDDGCFGYGAAGARDRSATRHEVFEVILFILADKALMKALVEQALHSRIDFALQGAMQKFVKLVRAQPPQDEFAEAQTGGALPPSRRLPC